MQRAVQEHKDSLVHLAIPDPRVILVQMERPGHREPPGFQVLRDRWATQVLRVPPDFPVPVDQLDFEDQPVSQVELDYTEKRVVLV